MDPRQPKSEWDMFIIAVIFAHGALFYFTSGYVRKTLFMMLFLFWRCSYNLGIGLLLHYQSNHNLLVEQARKLQLFDKTQNPRTFAFMKRQLADKMGKDFDFEASPIEYQTWLLFRRAVDLILMLDFCSYVLLAISWSYVPISHGYVMHSLRWAIGWALVLFNLWVKLDANRVVRDFAWYWGDFFYLIDSDLTFDGVYELCMHPMYSLGYAGYYGISLLACSYAVLFTSIIAHISQFIFLYVVEEPHINKIYSPKSQIRVQSRAQQAKEMISTESAFDNIQDDQEDGSIHLSKREVNIFRPFDPYRATDLTQMLIIAIGVLFALFTPQKGSYQVFSIVQALTWRLLHSIGICMSLYSQSEQKSWTKHYLKYGESPKKAWTEWKNIYALSLTMMHTTFLIAAWKSYSLPHDWQYSTCTLRHVLGLSLILMHIWTSISVYDVLGEFGWYFGDFFVDTRAPKLKYTGVYRYLNNPERIVYSFWGFALIANSNAIIALAIEAQILNLMFITFVEKPHMDKLYGEQVRKEAGFKRSLKSMPVVDHPQVKKKVEEIEGSFDKAVDLAVAAVKDCLDQARPHLDKAVEESKIRIHKYRNSITVTRIADLEGHDRDNYTLKLKTKTSLDNKYVLGEPIQIQWTAPANHSPKDWIGVYKVSDNASKEVTKVSSQGRWSAVHADGFSDHVSSIILEQPRDGIVEFRGDIIPWKMGSYEFRYHHAGMHNVMAISEPFEIVVPRSKEVKFPGIEEELLQFVGQILSSQPGVDAPRSADDLILYSDEAEKYASRIAYGIHKKYGVEFAWQLLASDESVRQMTARIVQSQKILAPFTRYQKSSPEKESQFIRV